LTSRDLTQLAGDNKEIC